MCGQGFALSKQCLDSHPFQHPKRKNNNHRDCNFICHTFSVIYANNRYPIIIITQGNTTSLVPYNVGREKMSVVCYEIGFYNIT